MVSFDKLAIREERMINNFFKEFFINRIKEVIEE
jgi:hypothetical protein